jgi:hypothetical protein
MMDDFQIVSFVDSLAFWCITVMHNPGIVKENSSTFTLLHTCCALLVLGDEECFHCDDCTFISGSYPYTHVSSSHHGLRELRIPVGALQHVPCSLKAELLLLLRKQLGLHMCKSSVIIECAEPVLIPTSSAISRIVKQYSRIREHTFSMTFAFRLVDRLPEH